MAGDGPLRLETCWRPANGHRRRLFRASSCTGADLAWLGHNGASNAGLCAPVMTTWQSQTCLRSRVLRYISMLMIDCQLHLLMIPRIVSICDVAVGRRWMLLLHLSLHVPLLPAASSHRTQSASRSQSVVQRAEALQLPYDAICEIQSPIPRHISITPHRRGPQDTT